jgi:hypothetical protein
MNRTLAVGMFMAGAFLEELLHGNATDDVLQHAKKHGISHPRIETKHLTRSTAPVGFETGKYTIVSNEKQQFFYQNGKFVGRADVVPGFLGVWAATKTFSTTAPRTVEVYSKGPRSFYTDQINADRTRIRMYTPCSQVEPLYQLTSGILKKIPIAHRSNVAGNGNCIGYRDGSFFLVLERRINSNGVITQESGEYFRKNGAKITDAIPVVYKNKKLTFSCDGAPSYCEPGRKLYDAIVPSSLK